MKRSIGSPAPSTYLKDRDIWSIFEMSMVESTLTEKCPAALTYSVIVDNVSLASPEINSFCEW